MEGVDLRDFRNLLRIVAVVAGGVMGFRNADFGIRAIALLPRQLEGDHPGDIRLKREDLQIEHELRVIGKRGRHAHWPVCIGDQVRIDGFFGALNFALDLANRVDDSDRLSPGPGRPRVASAWRFLL